MPMHYFSKAHILLNYDSFIILWLTSLNYTISGQLFKNVYVFNVNMSRIVIKYLPEKVLVTAYLFQ